ncbi:MAG: helix-turn-helix transcriptional regulator [Gammaproteobacteria bacterium]|nr:helix-turn-helix transcriptional regulator [Gammaproteobacteria bacterium]
MQSVVPAATNDVPHLKTYLTQALSEEKNNVDPIYLPHALDQHWVKLTQQQSRCFVLLLRGYTAKQMAEVMNLSYRTIQHYTATVYERLGFDNSRGLISHYVYMMMQ